MKQRHLGYILLLFSIMAYSQNKIEINATFDIPSKSIKIHQYLEYYNTTQDTLDVIYLNDWNHSYSSKTTPLAKRFVEEFNNKFHFAKSKARGHTAITSIEQNDTELQFERLEAHPDVIKVTLSKRLLPGASYQLLLNYTVVLPNDSFTGYGISPTGELNLKYWYITPAVYDGQWQYYSNKNLEDLLIPKADILIEAIYPRNYMLISELNTVNVSSNNNQQTVILQGNNRVDTRLILTKTPEFKFIKTDKTTIVTNLKAKDIVTYERTIIADKVLNFITEHLGAYPHQKLLVTESDYIKDPLYGLNQLPDFIRPFPDDFQYELKFLKTALNKYLENTLLINLRKDYWLKDAFQIYFLMKYVESNYPDTKLLGAFANIWGIRSFHASDLNFNAQYNLFFMQMARTNRDQPLTMSKDSLLKFNANIANKYKAGIGLKYLGDFIEDNTLENTIKAFLEEYKLQNVSPQKFETYLKQKTSKNIDWFFEDYINTRKKIDFKIKKIRKTEDSITITIKNKRHNKMPISLFSLKDDSIVSKLWIENIKDEKTLSIPKGTSDKLVLNYNNTIPEYNLRDNWKSLKGFFFNNKPLQFRLLKDIEDPNYNQVFFMPLIEYRNIYDGLNLGTKIYNKTILKKRFNYSLSPQYSTRSKTLTGSTTLYYTHFLENSNLFNITYGIAASYSSYGKQAFVTSITPSLSFSFRDDSNFRSNKLNVINLRYVDIHRDQQYQPIEFVDEPDYGVFNLRFIASNPGLVNYSKWFSDFQIAKKFSKVSFNYEYRKLTEANRQFNIRFFAGAFLYNNNPAESDYFSFALDRPTDYLFDYNYLGRSEDSGIFSQQIIIAEGGFKSKLETPFANQWMTTANGSTTIWRYIEAYGDLGLVKNKSHSPKFVYDSGIRLNLVTDYFEIYFPVYSNLGWEIGQPHYDQKIRFKFTVDPQSLLGLFRRKWY